MTVVDGIMGAINATEYCRQCVLNGNTYYIYTSYMQCELGPHYTAQTGMKLEVLLPQLPKYWVLGVLYIFKTIKVKVVGHSGTCLFSLHSGGCCKRILVTG